MSKVGTGGQVNMKRRLRTDCKSHLQIVGRFLLRKERRHSLPRCSKNKEQDRYYGQKHSWRPKKKQKKKKKRLQESGF